MTWTDPQARAVLRQLFDAAVASADPRRVLAAHLPQPPRGRCIVVGAGKAAALMAQAVEAAWPDVPLGGVVVTRYGHAVPTRRIAVVEAAHPVPDDNSLRAARLILQAVSAASRPDDLVLVLISGGGSALMALPVDGITLADKQQVNRLLLASGADIALMNAVRRRLSAVKGGKLARAAAPARVVTLAISDVPGDDPRVIASGPTVLAAGEQPGVDAFLERVGQDLPPHVLAALRRPEDAAAGTPAGDADYRLIATPMEALRAAAAVARRAGLTPVILGDALEGEASGLGVVMAGIARSSRNHGEPARPPVVLLSGGETTVSIGRGPAGRGGRNSEFLLSLMVALKGAPGIWALAGDTDGIDGSEAAAGAILAPQSWDRALAAGFDPARVLAAHDSYSLFAALDDLVVTGPTLTNVNDLRAILVA